MLPSFLMLDLETTGGSPAEDRIIEIAAVRVEEGREVARWSSLVNPGRWVSPFITSLTGIDNAMVHDAPRFEAVASRLLELLDGAVLVAHNVRFDHGFLKNEFQRMGIDLRVRLLCTVRLSRKLYPQHKGHGLDAIVRRHGLHNAARHRAMGDVDAVLDWLALAGVELGVEQIRHAAQELVSGVASVPPHLEAAIQDIPDAPGVYLMYGETRQPLYIGKSVHLRARVLSHFQADPTTGRDMQLVQQTRRLEFRRSAGELGALLLASRLIKELQPVYNRRLRRVAPLALAAHRVPDWPFTSFIAIREHDPHTGRTDIHLFDRWCHRATVHDEADLHAALEDDGAVAFDLDTYQMLVKRLAAKDRPNSQLIRLSSRGRLGNGHSVHS